MIVDNFAAEYGWAKDKIYFDLYPDEVIALLFQIKQRRASNYLMLLSIAHNPYLDKKESGRLFELLKSDIQIDNGSSELDKAAFDMLKHRLASNPQSKIIVK